MLTLLRMLGVLSAIAVGGVGILAMPLTTAAVVLPLAAAAGFGYVSNQAYPAAPSFRRRSDWVQASTVTAWTIAASYVLLGVVVLLGEATCALALLGVAAAVIWRAAHQQAVKHDDAGRVAHVAVVRTPLPGALTSLTTTDLCRVWRVSYLAVATQRDPAILDQLALTRRRYLDELEHRDPAGFRRWIGSGARAASDPAQYILFGGAEFGPRGDTAA